METTPTPNPKVLSPPTTQLQMPADMNRATQVKGCTHAPPNPLHQPEILAMIMSYLKEDRQALMSCVLVYRDFKLACEYLLWSDLVVHGNKQKKDYIPVKTLLTKALFVRSIKVNWDTPAEFTALTFPQLNKLHLIDNADEEQQAHWISKLNNLPAAFIQRHQATLQELWLKQFSMIEKAILFWRTVGMTPGLKSLGFQNVHITSRRNTKDFWKLCALHPTLQELHLIDCHLHRARGAKGVFRQQESTLRTLVLKNIFGDTRFMRQLYNLLEHSRGLRTFSYGFTDLSFPENKRYEYEPDELYMDSHFDALIESGNSALPHLTRLGFSTIQYVQSFNAFSTTLTDLSVAYGNFDYRSLEDLMLTFGTKMVSLNLLQCPNVTSDMIHSILCAFSGLKSIKADGLLATDVESSEAPWACHNLEAWHMAIYVDTDNGNSHSEVFLRLSGLTKLRDLDLSHTDSSYIGDFFESPDHNHFYESLQLQCSLGMNQLRSLRRLSTLSFKNTQQQLPEVDCQWILDSFPQLSEISGNVHTLVERNLGFALLAKKRHIRYCGDD